MPFLAPLQVAKVEGRQTLNLLMLGLDNCGKTTLLKRISDEDVRCVAPTKGFNAKSIVLPCGGQLAVWDMAGDHPSRAVWRHFFASSTAVIFVVDSADRGRMDEGRYELHSALAEDTLKGVPLLVLANKQDIDMALNEDEVQAELQLEQLRARGLTYAVRGCCAQTGAGVLDALQWLCSITDAHEELAQNCVDV
mmetsp:Transcript_56007/g.133444  ORF Transcript_56007/g.133444 Transcript_56007/m.133444 type:complete len:194 (+) Transcript_56007:67-648(+)